MCVCDRKSEKFNKVHSHTHTHIHTQHLLLLFYHHFSLIQHVFLLLLKKMCSLHELIFHGSIKRRIVGELSRGVYRAKRRHTLPIFIVFNITKQVNMWMWWTWLNQPRFFSLSYKKKNTHTHKEFFSSVSYTFRMCREKKDHKTL